MDAQNREIERMFLPWPPHGQVERWFHGLRTGWVKEAPVIDGERLGVVYPSRRWICRGINMLAMHNATVSDAAPWREDRGQPV